MEPNETVMKVVAAIDMLESLDEDMYTKRGKTRKWIKRREEKGYFNNIVKELCLEDTASYKEMLQMNHASFLFILKNIESDIMPIELMRGGNKVIYAAERLTLILRFLATGESYKSLSFQFRISERAISYIVQEVCLAIISRLSVMYCKVPYSTHEWLAIVKCFEVRWNYPHALGASDSLDDVILFI